MYFIFLRVLSKKICWKWVIWFIKSIGEFMPSFLLLKLSDTKQVNETSFSLTNNALSMLFFVQKKNKQRSTCHPPFYYYYYFIVVVVVEIQSSKWTFDFYSSTYHSLLLKRKTLCPNEWTWLRPTWLGHSRLHQQATWARTNWFLWFFCSLLLFFCSYFFFNFILQYRVFI